MASMEVKGIKSQDEVVKQYKLTIKGNQWTVNGIGGDTIMTFQIDPSKNPKTMDLTLKGGQLSRGIYKLDGDTLTLCRTVGNIDRPTEFKTSAQGGNLVVWKRAKK